MKRLCKTASRIVLSEFVKINMNDDAIQFITDCMAESLLIQIEYLNSGWRTVLPYGWNTSKAGDLLIMCYKDNTDIRSYRFDRILQLFVDDSVLYEDNDENYEIFDEDDYDDRNSPNDFIIPELPETDEILEMSEKEQGTDAPYEEAVDILEDNINQSEEHIDEENLNTEQDLTEKIKEEQKVENENE